jgi:hypothetical protein
VCATRADVHDSLIQVLHFITFWSHAAAHRRMTDAMQQKSLDWALGASLE